MGDDDTLPEPGAEGQLLPARVDAYKLAGLLGRGGMGEVWTASDDHLSREVALKRMRTTAPTRDELKRFLREARIQARLPHPSIVPVYELGTDAEGFPFFTMKKLVGKTLGDVLGTATTQRMLRALVDVCMAIQLAHESGIVHRDLKPSNIMLGDYGEVYVIDWGVARILDEDDLPPSEPSLDPSSDHTKTGQLLGTPGYMAPEQVRGQPVDAAADVYALGSILFEILAGEPLHPRGAAAIASTLDKHDGSPGARAPARAIPPELDALCRAALAEEPTARPTARALGEGIQRYLDGDRDLEQRRALAVSLVDEARAAAAADDRANALRLGGRALALDPSNEAAAGLVVQLVTAVPEKLPAEIDVLVAEHDREAMRTRSARAIYPLLAFFLITPFLRFLHVANWQPLAGIYVAIAVNTALAFMNWKLRRIPVVLWIASNVVFCVMFSRLAGPFVLTPVLICAVMMSASAQPWLNARRWAVILLAFVLVVAPYALEAVGVLAPSWAIGDYGVVSHGTIFAPGDRSPWSVFAANLGIVVLTSLFALGINRDRRLAQRELIIQGWHLRHLLPERTMRA